MTEEIVLEAARVMATKLAPFGYQYINLDCGWSTKHRDLTSGRLVVNATRFPRGMRALADDIHGLGLKFGMYGAMGYAQCCSGTADHTATDGSGPGCSKDKDHKVCRNETFYSTDAQLWASWGVDLVKFDGCGGGFDAVPAMRDALNATGRPIVYSVHASIDKGVMQTSFANMWRTGPDIGPSYEQVIDRALISNNVTVYLPGGPGGWGDPDMLQVGNIGVRPTGGSPPSLYPDAEGRTQFALWCLIKAPLLIGTWLNNVSKATLATLTDRVAIGVNQDRLGVQGALRRSGGWVPDQPRPTTDPAFGYQVWSGPLSNGGVAAVLANLDGGSSKVLSLNSGDLPASRRGTVSWHVVRAFNGSEQTGASLPLTFVVGPHDVVMCTLTPAATVPSD